MLQSMSISLCAWVNSSLYFWAWFLRMIYWLPLTLWLSFYHLHLKAASTGCLSTRTTMRCSESKDIVLLGLFELFSPPTALRLSRASPSSRVPSLLLFKVKFSFRYWKTSRPFTLCLSWSEIDNIVFRVASLGYFGQNLKMRTKRVKNVKLEEEPDLEAILTSIVSPVVERFRRNLKKIVILYVPL